MTTSHSPIRLLPRPMRMDVRAGSFTLDSDTAVRVSSHAEPALQLLRELLGPATGLPLVASAAGAFTMTIDAELTELGAEGYELIVDTDRVLLRAAALAGLRHGVQTLRQLLPVEAHEPHAVSGVAWSLPCVRITDVPRLTWRGGMLDVARHFQPIEYLYRFADLLAMHKANVMHLHLTDDQGWRMPVQAYPRLTEIGAYRRETAGDGIRHGGAYTRDELTDLVEYAARRGITVVPEIEMPGHARAALAAYPGLGNRPEREREVWTRWGVCENIFGVHDAVLDFCRAVLDETMQIFPSRYIHLGGDESPLGEWAESPRAAERIREKNLAGTRDLYRWFMGEVADHVARAGRRPIAWAEDDLTLPPTLTVMAWRDAEHGWAAAARGHDVVMAPHLTTYLDYAETTDAGEPAANQQGSIVLPLRTAQQFSAVPAGWEDAAASHVLGMQAQIWTEYLPTRELVEYRAFPRFSALADAAWGGVDDWDSFMQRLAQHRLRLDAVGVPRNVQDETARGRALQTDESSADALTYARTGSI